MTRLRIALLIALCGCALWGCKNRGDKNGTEKSGIESRIPGFFEVDRTISEIRVEKNGQSSVLKVNAATRPEDFNALVNGIRNAGLEGEMAESFTHRMDLRHPEGGVFADYDAATNCLYFKGMGEMKAGGPVVWPAAEFANTVQKCGSFWEGFPEE